jgi:hypothetical protein
MTPVISAGFADDNFFFMDNRYTGMVHSVNAPF